MTVQPDCKYAKSHEWAKLLPDGSVLVGITDYAQNSLGDITYVQLPKPGAVLKAGESFGVVESVKAASDLYAPIAGTVAAVNPALVSTPETVNRAPFSDGWMLKLQPADTAGLAALLSPADYAKETA
jgi:glycine cleavage system H protein